MLCFYLSKLSETSYAELLYDTQCLKKVLFTSAGQVNFLAGQVTFKAYLVYPMYNSLGKSSS